MRKADLTLLPSNSTQLEYDLELAMQRLRELPVDFQKLWSPNDCPKEFLPWLAWAMSVDIWRTWWPEQTQRDIIKESIQIHWKKGTPWAVKRLLELAGTPDVEIVEWWQIEPRGEPYTFCVYINSNPSFNPYTLDLEQYRTIRRLIETTKPVRADYCLRVQSSIGNIEPKPLAMAGATRFTNVSLRTLQTGWKIPFNDSINLAGTQRHTAVSKRSMDTQTGRRLDANSVYLGASKRTTAVASFSMDLTL
jgi:phage tail P2-like protein